MLQTISITVKGKVQGIFYRQSAKELAHQLGISGQIKNLPDGNVQIIATGTKVQLDQLMEWCKKGPPNAIVAGINFRELPLQEFSHFTIVRF